MINERASPICQYLPMQEDVSIYSNEDASYEPVLACLRRMGGDT